MDWRHIIQTPTFLLTVLGIFATISHLRRVKYMDAAAVGMLLTSGSGVAIALHQEVLRKEEIWGWRGLARALRKPSREFYYGFFGHLTQLLLASVIIGMWRATSKRN